MTEFEFLFILYALVLGLSLVELLGGLGRALEYKFARDAGGHEFHIGWLTPLLAVFVMLDLLSFWAFAWTVRSLLSVNSATLLGVMAFASVYFLAARLVFPTEPDNFVDLDNHYFRVRRVILALLIALVFAQWAFLLSIPELRSALMAPLSIGMTVLLIALMGALAVIRHEKWTIALLLVLIARYVVLYLT